jgi:hypothetical protein
MVLDSSIGQAAEAQSRAFKETADYGAIIITKTDGAAAGGGAISAVAASHTPIVFIGTGEHLLDLEKFNPESFISKLMGMGDMAGLVEHVQSLQLDQKDTMKHHPRLARPIQQHNENGSSVQNGRHDPRSQRFDGTNGRRRRQHETQTHDLHLRFHDNQRTRL